MLSFAGEVRLASVECLHAMPEVGGIDHASPRLTGVAMLAAAFLSGCDPDCSPTAQTTPGLTAEAPDHNVADHFGAWRP